MRVSAIRFMITGLLTLVFSTQAAMASIPPTEGSKPTAVSTSATTQCPNTFVWLVEGVGAGVTAGVTGTCNIVASFVSNTASVVSTVAVGSLHIVTQVLYLTSAGLVLIYVRNQLAQQHKEQVAAIEGRGQQALGVIVLLSTTAYKTVVAKLPARVQGPLSSAIERVSNFLATAVPYTIAATKKKDE
jgi:hypothetical protein